MYAYELMPIDHGWEFLPLVEDVIAKLMRDYAAATIVDDHAAIDAPSPKAFIQDFRKAQAMARDVGWEGDYRSDAKPRVFWLPSPNTAEFVYGFAWKQDNNGSTFVISPLPLPYLDELA